MANRHCQVAESDTEGGGSVHMFRGVAAARARRFGVASHANAHQAVAAGPSETPARGSRFTAAMTTVEVGAAIAVLADE